MSSTIRISNDVLAVIESHGRFGEKHNDVLRRLLVPTTPAETSGTSEVKKVVATAKRGRPRLSSEEVTPQVEYMPMILKILGEAKGYAMRVDSVIRRLEASVVLRPRDRELHKTGAIRWVNNAQWARQKLVDQGLLYPPDESGWGIWKLTDKGVEQAIELL